MKHDIRKPSDRDVGIVEFEWGNFGGNSALGFTKTIEKLVSYFNGSSPASPTI